MGIYYRSLWINELSMEEIIYFGLGLLAFYLVTYTRGVRSFLNKRIVYFNFVSRSHAKINPVWHDIYVYSNSDNECSSCCCYVTSVDEKYWVTKIQVVLFWLFFTLFRCMLSLLTRYIHVRVWKGWLLWIIKM